MMRKYASTVWLILPVAIGGCQISPLDASWPQPRALASEFATNRADVSYDVDRPDLGDAVEPVGPLTLNQALRLSLAHHPALASFAWEVRIRDARAEQAGRYPNPDLAIEIENFGGSGEASGFDSVETTISIAQVIPRGDRIKLAVRVAELNRDLAGWDYEAARIQVASMTARRYLDVLVTQRRIVVAERNMELAERVADVAKRRVAAGDVPPRESARAEVTAFDARLRLAQAKLDLEAARRALVNQWGGIDPRFAVAEGELELLGAIPALNVLLDQLDQNPDLALWATEISWRRARLVLAEALANPDVTIEGGVRYIGESDDTALVALLNIPLTINDRNQSGIHEARAELMKVGHDRRLVEISLRQTLAQFHRDLQASHLEAETLHDDMLPAAQSVFDAVNRAYEQGQIGWLEMIDAHRTLMDLQSRYLESLASYHRATVQIEGLIGQKLPIPNENESKTNSPPEKGSNL